MNPEDQINVPPTAPIQVDPNVMPPGPVNYQDPAVAAAVQRARQEEKQKLYSTLDKNKRTLQNMENRQGELLNEIETLRSQVAKAGQPELKGDAAVMAKVDELNRSLQDATRRNEDLNRQIRQSQLESYKERRLREAGGEVFVEMVGGVSEAEIDESINRAQEHFQRQRDFFYQQFSRTAPQPHPGHAYSVQPGYGYPPPVPGAYYPNQGQPPQAAPVYVAEPTAPEAFPLAPAPAPALQPIPANRGYYQTAMAQGAMAAGVPGVHHVPAAPSPGFPSVSAGVAPAPQRATQHDLKTMTSEDAIRSGNYKENRAAILASVRQQHGARR